MDRSRDQLAGTPGYIIVGGRHVPCAVPVEPWTVNRLAFPGLGKRSATDLVVLHWTGGEGGAEQVHRTLRSKSLSVHFVVDADGAVTQHCDADMLCAHAAGMNVRAVGIEVVNRATDEADRVPRRTLMREKIRGRDTTYTAFLPAQVRSCIALCIALCEAYGLPLDVPRVAPGGDVLAREFTAQELAAYRGVCGHFHWSPAGKRDPGLAVLRAVAAFDARGRIGLSGPL